MPVRLSHDQRKRIITSSAVRVALRDGLAAITPKSVADECITTTSEATVRSYFRTIGTLQLAVIEEHSTSDKLRNEATELGLI